MEEELQKLRYLILNIHELKGYSAALQSGIWDYQKRIGKDLNILADSMFKIASEVSVKIAERTVNELEEKK